jgi:hypothetical protein
MSDDELLEFKKQLDRIERCLVGDPAMGQVGLVTAVRSHGGRIGKLERWRDTSKVKIAAIITTASVVVTSSAWLIEHFAMK